MKHAVRHWMWGCGRKYFAWIKFSYDMKFNKGLSMYDAMQFWTFFDPYSHLRQTFYKGFATVGTKSVSHSFGICLFNWTMNNTLHKSRFFIKFNICFLSSTCYFIYLFHDLTHTHTHTHTQTNMQTHSQGTK